MKDEGLIRPESILPEGLYRETVVLVSYQPILRRIQTLAPSRALGRLGRTIPVFYVQTDALLFLGPVVGAPAAAILMEGLVAGGVREVLVLGVCGSLRETTRIGDILLVDAAYAAEGTSHHYFPERWTFPADAALLDRVRRWLERVDCPHQCAALVSTDAPFRETPAFIERFQTQGAAGVDMEISAIYALGQFYGVGTAGCMITSDELTGGRWRRGFTHSRFRESCNQLATELVRNGL